MLGNVSTLVDLLCQRSCEQMDAVLYTFLVDGEVETDSLTYRQVDIRARAVAAHLQSMTKGKDARVLLLFPPGLDYITAFFGCLYAGVTAVPLYPPRLDLPLDRFKAVVADAQATMVLTDSAIFMLAQHYLVNSPELAGLQWVAVDTIPDDIANLWTKPALTADSLAFLQYTSGSTAEPKGVMICHANLLHNLAHIYQCFNHSPESRGVIWLPPYHDMGLIGGILQPLYGGFPVVLMSPLDFLKQPLYWLKAITRYQATTSGGPNFAYDLCVRKISPSQREQLDLSSWHIAFNGAEPVRYETLTRFTEAFASSGFRQEAFYPCYGLAEATLIVSGGEATTVPVTHTIDRTALSQSKISPPHMSQNKHILVSSGQTLPDQELIIVDFHTAVPCPPQHIGEIWLKGPSIASGYWHNTQATDMAFNAYLAHTGEGPYFRTGDLGYVNQNNLFVTGRIKDLIIFHGRNYYPQDIEQTVEQSHPALRPGRTVAFAVSTADQEKLVVAQEIRPQYQNGLDTNEVIQTIRQAILQENGIQPDIILLLEKESLPKTSSGKIQRYLCRQQFLSNELNIIAQSRAQQVVGNQTLLTHRVDVQARLRTVTDSVAKHALLINYLQSQTAHYLQTDPNQIDVQKSFIALGVDSIMAVELANTIEEDLGVTLPMVFILEGKSIYQLAMQIHSHLNKPSATIQHTKSSPSADKHKSLSYAQERLWFLNKLEPSASSYNIPVTVYMEGPLNSKNLQQSLNQIIGRHESLRTTFITQNGQGIPLVHPNQPLHLPIINLDHLPPEAQQIQKDKLITDMLQKPFILNQGPLIRGQLLHFSPTNHILNLTLHHIIADGWSMGILLKELAHYYHGLATHSPSSLPPLSLQYTEYAFQHRQWLQAGPMEKQLAYWQEQLADAPFINLPVDNPQPTEPLWHGANYFFDIPQRLVNALQELSHREETTLFMTLLTVFKVLLNDLTKSEDIIVGTDIANRHNTQTRDLIGLFVNQLVLRTDMSGNPTFRELLRRVRTLTLSAFAHQDVPFHKLVETLNPKRDHGHNPLFQVMFVLENTPMPSLSLSDITLHLLDSDSGGSPFDLSLLLSNSAQGLRGEIKYKKALFKPQTIERWGQRYQSLLEVVVTQPEASLASLKEQLAQVDEQYRTIAAEKLRKNRIQKYSQIKRKPVSFEP
jgi:acyl-CoA synthetase (AMP-forming)/AMP-acid ligase II/acyl carrier protein